MQDRLNAMSEELKQKLDFMSANDELMKSKMETQAKVNQEKHKERMNYFPFTHGDALEKQRTTIQEVQKRDLNELHKARVQRSADRRRARKEKALENQAMQEDRQRQLLEMEEFREFLQERHLQQVAESDPTLALEYLKTSQLMVQPHVPDLPLLADPYLRVEKGVHPSRRFRNSTHLLRTMEAAIIRKKQDQDEEKRRQQEFLQQHLSQIVSERQNRQEEAGRLHEQKKKMRDDWAAQAESDRRRRDIDDAERKEATNNTFGPSETPALSKYQT